MLAIAPNLPPFKVILVTPRLHPSTDAIIGSTREVVARTMTQGWAGHLAAVRNEQFGGDYDEPYCEVEPVVLVTCPATGRLVDDEDIPF